MAGNCYCIVSPENIGNSGRCISSTALVVMHPPRWPSALKNGELYHHQSLVQEKRDYFQHLMKSTRFTALPSHGSYFQVYRYERISDESDRDFSIRITKEYGVASIPVSVFYRSGKDDHVVRFCFCKKKETLDEAVERLSKIK
jgi:methionine aminotransferase